MLDVVVQHLVVDLVGKHHQAVLTRQLQDLQQQFLGVQRTRGVVGVDDHDGLGAGRDLGADVLQIRHPAVVLVAHVVHGRATGQAGHGRPQRIVRRWQQHLVAVVQQGVGGQGDQLRGAIAQVDVVQRHSLDALALGFVHHGLARREDALAVGIAGRVGQVADHVLLHFLGGIEAEHRQIADVQLDDLVTVLFHLLGRIHDRPSDVIADVGQLCGFLDSLHGNMPPIASTAPRRARAPVKPII